MAGVMSPYPHQTPSLSFMIMGYHRLLILLLLLQSRRDQAAPACGWIVVKGPEALSNFRALTSLISHLCQCSTSNQKLPRPPASCAVIWSPNQQGDTAPTHTHQSSTCNSSDIQKFGHLLISSQLLEFSATR